MLRNHIFSAAFLAACLGLVPFLARASVEQVANIAPEPGEQTSSIDGNADIFMGQGGTLFFSAETITDGTELWVTDGTAAGTHLVKDIAPGDESAIPDHGVLLNGKLYFTIEERSTEALWVSDGTTAGTRQIFQLAAQPEADLSIIGLAAANGKLWFVVETNSFGSSSTETLALWSSDGSTAGTHQITTLASLTSCCTSVRPEFTAVGGKVVFAAHDGASGDMLWVTDGTAAGTETLSYPDPDDFVVLSDQVFFTSNDNVYKTDGSIVTAVDMTDSGASGATAELAHDLTVMDGNIYFVATDSAHGYELWRTDGATTELVADVIAGTTSSYPAGMVAVGNTLFFEIDSSGDSLLYKSDGTAGGTQEVMSLGTDNLYDSIAFNGKLYFRRQSNELWASNGTAAGTTRIGDFETHGSLAVSGDKLYFGADDGVHGHEPWVSDGTAAGTVMIADIGKADAGSYPDEVTPINGKLIFEAYDEDHGYEPWISDGTESGTRLIADIRPGADGSEARGFTLFGGAAYFTADDGDHGYELWKYDITTGAASLVKDINPGSADSDPYYMTALDGKLWFVADTSSGRQLWQTDGTSAGTTAAIDFTGFPSDLTVAGGKLFYDTYDFLTSSAQLYVTDGTVAGTVQLTSFPSNSGDVSFVTAIDDDVYFIYDGDVWISDGTTAGTKVVANSINGLKDSDPEWWTAYQGAFWLAVDTTTGEAIWKVDGSAAGAVKVADIDEGGPPVNYAAEEYAVAGGKLYFVATTPASGTELWVTDGTTDGTRLVTNINGADSSFPYYLAPAGDRVVFAATDGVNGYEPWISDGTAEGTHLIADINPDAGNSNPYGFTVIDRSLYFSAEDGKTGDELWRADIDRLPVATDMEATTAFETAYSGTLSATDGDSDPLTFAIVNQPEHGKVKLSDATKGTFTYTPDDGFSGADSFTFTANDGYDTSAPGTVELTVQDEPTPPSDNGGDNAGGSQGQAPASSGGGGAFGFLAGLLLMGLALRRRHP